MPTDREPTRLEQLSAPVLRQLARVPSWMILVVALGLTAGGLLLDNVVGAVLLFALALFLAWLAILGWPRLTPFGRVIRLFVVGLVVYVAFSKLV